MRYFDIYDWKLDELVDNIRERILESKKPLPKKVMRHLVIIVYRCGEGSYIFPNRGYFAHGVVPEFKTRQEAEDYLNQCDGIIKIGDGAWVEDGYNDTYTKSDGTVERCHYTIRESDYEEYEDGEHHTEYGEEEKKMLSEALYNIEKARVYMRVYDHCCDQYSFGDNRFSNELKRELEKFEKEYTEELPEDYKEE